MGRLLDKIKAQGAADLRICGKQAGATLPESATSAESCGFQSQIKSNPQNPQSLRTLKPAPDIAFHKSASPQGVPNDFENRHPENIRTKIRASSNQSKLVRLAIQTGVFNQGVKLEKMEVAALVPPSDWRDVANCTPDELKAWGAALAMRAVRYRGKVPAGWDKVAHCQHCGPVYSFHDQHTLSCGWCEMRLAGKWFPQPETQE
jgi:hypothetical protein